MEKRIKKEIAKALCSRGGALEDIIQAYYSENKGKEKGVIVRRYYFERRGYRATMRELRRCGYYCERSQFYRLKDEVLSDIAMRACYEHLICPYSDKTSLNE